MELGGSRKPLRVLFVTPLYQPYVGGATAFVAAMARRLMADGHEATVLTTAADSPERLWRRAEGKRALLPLAQNIDGVRVERLHIAYPRPGPQTFAVLRRLGHILARSPLPEHLQRPALDLLARWMPWLPGLRGTLERLAEGADVVHLVESSWDGLFTQAAEVALGKAKPLVVTPLMHLGGKNVRAHFEMAHQVDVYRRASAVIALSRPEAEAYEHLRVAAKRIHHLPMGVDPILDRLLQPELGQAFRSAHGISGPVVAFLGANTYDKGAWTLALAASELNRKGAAVHVVFAGPNEEALRTFLLRQPDDVRAGLAGRIHILGLVPEDTKHALLSACDMLALPSQVDAFGIVLLEAWQHGKPVIGAAAGGIPDLVREGETGLLVPFGSVPALAAAIQTLLADRALAERLGAIGRDRVSREYTWDHTYSKLEGIYAAAVATQRH